MVESKISMSFPRDYYLECAEEFEANRIDCVDQELSEFNHDEEDLAYELAYTRYTLAREELELEHLRAQVAELKAERDRLRFNGVRAVSILEVVHGLADSALERKDLEAAIKLLEES